MPFRNRNLLNYKKRTSEPFPAKILRLDKGPPKWTYPDGYGKASGSYTEKMRLAFQEWMEKAHGSAFSPLIFQYKLSRHRTVTIVGSYPYIKHLPYYGNGKRGFVLSLRISSIDGSPFKGFGKRQQLAWNRIIGREKMLYLEEGKEWVTQ